jgi:transcriptional regulator with XRE-family HTH domain
MDEKKQYLIGLGNRIKSRRQELNMSQEELANKCGYKSRSTINKIELGINDVPQSKINAIASALDSTVGYIMGWTSEPHQLSVY